MKSFVHSNPHAYPHPFHSAQASFFSAFITTTPTCHPTLDYAHLDFSTSSGCLFLPPVLIDRVGVVRKQIAQKRAGERDESQGRNPKRKGDGVEQERERIHVPNEGKRIKKKK